MNKLASLVIVASLGLATPAFAQTPSDLRSNPFLAKEEPAAAPAVKAEAKKAAPAKAAKKSEKKAAKKHAKKAKKTDAAAPAAK